MNCSTISGSHVLSKVNKRLVLGWNCSLIKWLIHLVNITKTNLKYLTHITQGKKKSKWFKVTNSRISRGMFIKNQKGREHYDSSFGLESLDDASCTSSVLRFRTISANSSSSSSFPSLYDKWGDILYPRDL